MSDAAPPEHARASRLTLAAVLGVAIGLTVFALWPRGPRLSVLIVSIDTTRADLFAIADTPNADAVAARGATFTQARTPVPITLPAHASILTGVYPPTHGVRTNTLGPYRGSKASGVLTLAETLKQRGYATGAFVSGATLDAALGLSVGFDTYDDHFEKSASLVAVGDRPAGATATIAAAWIKARRTEAPGEPWFAFVHFFDPHAPYGSPGEPGTDRERYQREIERADAGLGLVLAEIDPATTIVVVTSDHGEGLGDHGEDTHSYFLYDSTLHVPLIVAAPNMPPSTIARPASLVDIAPTIRALLGLSGTVERAGLGDEVPTGIDLFGTSESALARTIYAETVDPYTAFGFHPLQCGCAPGGKLIWSSSPELYDPAADPSEARNTWDAAAGGSAAAHGGLRDFVARFGKRAPPVAGGTDLSGGGYYAALHVPAMPDNELWALTGPDRKALDAPTQRAADIRAVQEVNRLLHAGDIERATRSAGDLAAARPSMIRAQQLYCTALAAIRTAAEKQSRAADALRAAGAVGDQALAVAALMDRMGINADEYRFMAAANLARAGRRDEARALLPRLPDGQKKTDLTHLIEAGS